MRQYFIIKSSARYLPRTRITAEELDRRLGLRAGWTFQHTGVEQRFQASGEETAATMAREVVGMALARAELTISEVDLIIDASLCVQQPVPCNAALIKEALGPEATGIPAYDVHASCLGFLAALQVVNGLCASGIRRILVVCSETPLNGVNWKEPESACLMGDGAAAFVFEATPDRSGAAFRMQTFSEGAAICRVRGGGHRLPPSAWSKDRDSEYRFHMDGPALHRLASKHLPALVDEVLLEAGCTLGDLEVVPHQASGPALELMARRLKIESHRLHTSIARHGNLVAAGIPYVLHDVCERYPPETRVLLLGTAAGYSQGAAVFRL